MGYNLNPITIDAQGKKTRTYFSYRNMINRCYREKDPRYHRYGGRGIKVCDRWRYSFANFLVDMGEKPEGLTLDRKNNDGDYTPSNCVWGTAAAQAHNRHTTVLDWETVRALRKVFNQRGKRTHREMIEYLSKLSGLPKGTISNVIYNLQWKE